ncbi:MAG: hypothetical protein CL802_14955 [Citromicrobium sp.]|nr:hypothetical protein [Citromicrobium sp.]
MHSNDRAQALEFYRPYFTCYYNHLSKSAGFGSSDSEVATEAMLEASKDCDDERSLADQLLNDLLVKRKVYGDESHRAVVVELFRREEGSDFVFAMALEDGVSGQLKIMSDAYFEKVLSPQ